ncbi:protein kinase c-binding protein nell1-like protein [Lasius niger]|uniref:Protein kinase c-binding protein nell1-like protein n=1 Tax=Lasius niger TaxID=67767 RepID=A0A0J7L8Q0_LASNI|nr:protein kinase c-binding protein nell1-like protein [Lasius niger]
MLDVQGRYIAIVKVHHRVGSDYAVRLIDVTVAMVMNATNRDVSGTTNKKEEETAVPSATEETTEVLGTKTRTGNDPGGGIDLLAALQLHNTTRQGVTQVPGLVRLKPAYYLQDNNENFLAIVK